MTEIQRQNQTPAQLQTQVQTQKQTQTQSPDQPQIPVRVPAQAQTQTHSKTQRKSRQTSKQMLAEMMAGHYQEARDAKERGEPVAWSTSIAPQELLETLDIKTIYPENHAAAIGARKESQRFIDQAEGMGYSLDLCSYARVNLGYKELLCSESENIPLPDFIFCTSNICNTVLKWYENLAKDLHIPMITFDTPFNHTYEVPEHGVRYIKSQFQEAIPRLEEITGRQFDYDRLKKVMKQSNETARMWKDAALTARTKPSPLSGFDLFNYMAAILAFRGKKEGYRLFQLWKEELDQKAAAGLGPWKDQTEERFRILWDGIACWPYLSPTYKALKNSGINMVTSTYPDSWTILYESGDLDGMARAYSSNYVNRNLDYSVDNLVKLIEEFSLDGIVFHSNRSCKLMDFRQYEVQRRVEERTGISTVIFDGDQTDPRAFSTAQYETRIQALLEMMEAKKRRRMG